MANKQFCLAIKTILITIVLSVSYHTKAKGVDSISENPETSKVATFKFHQLERENKSPIAYNNEQKQSIKMLTLATIRKMRKLTPNLAQSILFNVRITERDLSMVNGVTGRADRPNEVEITLSSRYKSGINDAIKEGLEGTLFHELHHTVRGWTIYGNKFGPGIDIATINEGLADVFSEIQVGHAHNYYSNDVDFDAWTKEILALPRNANYGEWMFSHPDGREAIGYRTGAFLIKKAMKNSGKSILEMSKLSIKEIYTLAGY